MKRSNTLLIVGISLGVLALLLIVMSIGAYNRFVTLDQNVQAQWSEVENQYQRQADLIPNLVSVVSSSVSVETKFVKDVIAARTAWQGAQTQIQKDTAGQQMSGGVNAFVSAVAESYPVLQANTQYIALTDELSGTQNRITVARGRYIDSIQSYNNAVRRFPGNIFAGIFGFEAQDYYQASSGTETPTLGSGQLP